MEIMSAIGDMVTHTWKDIWKGRENSAKSGLLSIDLPQAH
jgi:hypothetical protein